MRSPVFRSEYVRHLLAFALLVACLFVSLTLLKRVRRPDTLTFVLTADTQGLLVPCGCSVTPSGGLARRAAFLKDLRAKRPDGTVVPVEVTHPFSDRGPARDLINGAMADFFRREGYGIVGLGPLDLPGGIYRSGEAAGLPLRLAGAKGLEGSVEYRLGGWGVGALGRPGDRLRVVVLGEEEGGPKLLPDPVAALMDEMAAHEAEGWVVLGRLSPGTAQRIVQGFPSVIALVAQWHGVVTSKPQDADRKWVVFMGDRGRRACTLDVTRNDSTWGVWPEVRYLDAQVPSDPRVEAGVKGVLEEVAEANARALEATVKPPEPGGAFVGAGRCKGCHPSEYAIWSPSSHAKGTSKLAVDHQEDNPACLACHATGVGLPGGYPRGDLDLAGVQCEACHGPGEGHPPRALRVEAPSRESCGGCHTERDSPLFEPDGFWQLIRHGPSSGR